MSVALWVTLVVEAVLLAWSLRQARANKLFNPGTVGLQITLASLMVCVLVAPLQNVWAAMINNLSLGVTTVGMGLYLAYTYIDTFTEAADYRKYAYVRSQVFEDVAHEMIKIAMAHLTSLSSEKDRKLGKTLRDGLGELLMNYTGERKLELMDTMVGQSLSRFSVLKRDNVPRGRAELERYLLTIKDAYFEISTVLLPRLAASSNYPGDLALFSTHQRLVRAVYSHAQEELYGWEEEDNADDLSALYNLMGQLSSVTRKSLSMVVELLEARAPRDFRAGREFDEPSVEAALDMGEKYATF